MTTPGSTAASGDEGRFRRLSDHSLLDSFLRNPRKKACILPIKARPPAEIRNWKLEIARLRSEASPLPVGNWQEKNAEKQGVL
jgi:hypothetical protein